MVTVLGPGFHARLTSVCITVNTEHFSRRIHFLRDMHQIAGTSSPVSVVMT